MIISIASGKGGTGKTTVATNLAAVSANGAYVDCDVEEPNGHLFLKPDLEEEEPVHILVPRVDHSKCTFCGDCREACRFGALAVLPKSVLVFDELCHGCGGCKLACPEKAIREEKVEIGVVQKGHAGSLPFLQGKLAIGQAMSPPVIRKVKSLLPEADPIIIDAPPGTSCPVVTTVNGTDVCVLVTEPTPFGLNDLVLAVEMVRLMGIPFGVIINRDGAGDDRVERYCEKEGIQVLAKIPDNRKLAEAYSRGTIAVEDLPEMADLFRELLDNIMNLERSKGRGAA